MTEGERVELAAIAITYEVIDLPTVLSLRGNWEGFADRNPDIAALHREKAMGALNGARAAKRGGTLTSWDWLLNA